MFRFNAGLVIATYLLPLAAALLLLARGQSDFAETSLAENQELAPIITGVMVQDISQEIMAVIDVQNINSGQAGDPSQAGLYYQGDQDLNGNSMPYEAEGHLSDPAL